MKSNFTKYSSIATIIILIATVSSSFGFPAPHTNLGGDVENINQWTNGGYGDFHSNGPMGADLYKTSSATDEPPTDAVTSVPEPATIALMIAGLIGIGLLQRHRQNKTT
ncbi:MAG: PEP-CTERM sorting domain-containing protein [candidate division Zixibacteria bacterium]|nr:PEP-CTERM sorting domain-containing protein [candidate division Zixibacteria bacterium]MDH3936016.1 PEP-CTERM sorting domain-containing protein [candidate division Zixibacteria bacterium]MDH4033640.1 PEP-CTERM sorting domain-containing protein [candidate division Zixibacteria bacterium]